MGRGQAGQRSPGAVRVAQGEIARLVGAYPIATEQFEDALGFYRELGDQRKGMLEEVNLALTRFEADPSLSGSQVATKIEALEEAQLMDLAQWFWGELALFARRPEDARTWADRAAAGGNAHLELIAAIARQRAALLAGEAGVDDDLATRLDEAVTVFETPLGLLVMAAAGGPGLKANALTARAEVLLGDQAAGLPKALREALADQARSWRTELEP